MDTVFSKSWKRFKFWVICIVLVQAVALSLFLLQYQIERSSDLREQASLVQHHSEIQIELDASSTSATKAAVEQPKPTLAKEEEPNFDTNQTLPISNAQALKSSKAVEKACKSLVIQSNQQEEQYYENNTRVENATFYTYRTCADIQLGLLLDESALPSDERSVSIAFGILLYKDVRQFERLLRAIYRPHHFYCVHVDRNSQQSVKDAVQRISDCFENVFTASEPVHLQYARISQVDAELACMRDSVARSRRWSWYINLTGQEFPLKSMWQLVRILQALNGTNSISAGEEKWAEKERKKPMRPFTSIHGLIPTSGATHIVAVRGFIEYAALDPLARSFRDALTEGWNPDETFFNTLNNSPHLQLAGAATVVKKAGTRDFFNRLKRFRGAGTPPCQSQHYVHDVCIFGVDDLPYMTNSSRLELFVNKLYWNFQHWTLDCLEWWHAQNTAREYAEYKANSRMRPKIDEAFYRQYAKQFRPY